MDYLYLFVIYYAVPALLSFIVLIARDVSSGLLRGGDVINSLLKSLVPGVNAFIVFMNFYMWLGTLKIWNETIYEKDRPIEK